MLQIVIQKDKKLSLLTELRSDDITEAITIAQGALINNCKYKRAFIYLKNNGQKPVKIKTVKVSWTGKLITR